jgi:hypothetical protein
LIRAEMSIGQHRLIHSESPSCSFRC